LLVCSSLSLSNKKILATIIFQSKKKNKRDMLQQIYRANHSFIAYFNKDHLFLELVFAKPNSKRNLVELVQCIVELLLRFAIVLIEIISGNSRFSQFADNFKFFGNQSLTNCADQHLSLVCLDV